MYMYLHLCVFVGPTYDTYIDRTNTYRVCLNPSGLS